MSSLKDSVRERAVLNSFVNVCHIEDYSFHQGQIYNRTKLDFMCSMYTSQDFGAPNKTQLYKLQLRLFKNLDHNLSF